MIGVVLIIMETTESCFSIDKNINDVCLYRTRGVNINIKNDMIYP